ncbi:MAG: hypothetical protein H0W62_14590 [Chitinophagales bacterium]|nr:hypothetical protein [Chitinophagales bacterium]
MNSFYCRSFCCLLYFLGTSYSVWCQQLAFSAPQKITAGNAQVEILGRNSQGTLIREKTKSDDVIAAYFDDLQFRWKKNLPRKERNADIQKILIDNDSLIFFYTVPIKNDLILKAFKTNARLESYGASVICDTVTSSFVNGIPRLQFTVTPDRQKILIYYDTPVFRDNKLLYGLCLSNSLKKLWKIKIKVKAVEAPDLIDAIVDSAGNGFYVVGDMNIKSFNNDFPYSTLNLICVRGNADRVDQYVLNQKDQFLGECKAKLDAERKNVVLTGLYSNNEGNESNGVYYFIFNLKNDSLIAKSLEPYNEDFLIQLTGNNPPHKNDGFFNFKPVDLIVKRDGGAIFISESQSVSSETYNNTAYNGFGFSTGFTVNYYHYDDLAVYSFSSGGVLEWKQILHKTQTSEGDGGFYSSFITLIGPDKLYFVYNDIENGQTSVSSYSLTIKGDQARSDIFSADRKGVMIIPQSSRQVSPFDIILPSIKRNYLQFVKISF